jgi:hypothetical protein
MLLAIGKGVHLRFMVVVHKDLRSASTADEAEATGRMR